MGLTALARDRLRMEGLGAIDHFSEFKVEELKMAIKNIKQPIPGDATADPPVAPIAAVYLSAKCFHRLKVASHAYHYYMDIGRAPTPANMNYSSVLKGFYIEWEAVQKLIDEDKPSVPILNPKKGVTPLKWLESFKDCLFHTFGVRGCPLSYVCRGDAEVPSEVDDPLAMDDNVAPPVPSPYGSSGSIIDEMIKRMTHEHPLFKTDNNTVYSMLEEATRGTPFAMTVKSYSNSKNGRAA